jgi:hypothetical protein
LRFKSRDVAGLKLLIIRLYELFKVRYITLLQISDYPQLLAKTDCRLEPKKWQDLQDLSGRCYPHQNASALGIPSHIAAVLASNA